MSDLFEDYFGALLNADTPAATFLLEQELTRGVSPVRLIRDVIARGQEEVGKGWAHGSMTMADEHAATAVTEQALAVVTQSYPATASGRRIVVACPEGEWHSMPARLAGELAKTAGLSVTLLGASLPADQLQAHLARTTPDALALSVTLTTNLVGAHRSIQAAHRAGVPVIVGGSAWGTNRRRALALGADDWLADARWLPAAVEKVCMLSDLVESPQLAGDVHVLVDAPPNLAAEALERHLARRRTPLVLSLEQANDRLLDYQWLMRYTAAAVACGDPTVLGDMLEWWADSMARDAFDPHWALSACEHLAVVTESVAPVGAAMLRHAAERHRGARFRQTTLLPGGPDIVQQLGVPRWETPEVHPTAHR